MKKLLFILFFILPLSIYAEDKISVDTMFCYKRDTITILADSVNKNIIISVASKKKINKDSFIYAVSKIPTNHKDWSYIYYNNHELVETKVIPKKTFYPTYNPYYSSSHGTMYYSGHIGGQHYSGYIRY